MMFPLFRNKNRCSTSKKPPPARFLEFLRQLHVATARLRAQAAGRKTLRRRGSGELEDFQVQSYLHGGLHWYGGWKKMEEIHDQLIGGKHPTIGFQPSLWCRISQPPTVGYSIPTVLGMIIIHDMGIPLTQYITPGNWTGRTARVSWTNSEEHPKWEIMGNIGKTWPYSCGGPEEACLNLVGGLEHFLFVHILGIIIPTD